MRAELSNFLVEKALANPNFVVLSGDHGYALFDDIRKHAPKQFLNVGVSEQGMVGYAAGLAKSGFQVAVYGLAAFVPTRVFEFIKMDVCYDNLPIIFLGDGAGLVYNSLGASHQSAEDVAMIRTLPNIDVFSPSDRFELQQCAEYAYQSSKASYLRIGKCDKAPVHAGMLPKGLPQPTKIRHGKKPLVLLGTGSMTATALELAEQLSCSVVSVPRLSEFTLKDLNSCLQHEKTIVTLEEHSIYGGLGSLVAEFISEQKQPNARVIRIGIKNRFTEKNGSYEYAIREHGLDAASILQQLKAYEIE